MKKLLKDMDLKSKRVLVRVDFNVPIENREITGDDRIRKSLPTIKYLLDNKAKVILMSHLGRPKGEYKKEFSLEPVAKRLGELLGINVKFSSEKDVVNDNVKKEAEELKEGEVMLLENLRFRKEEEKNDDAFSKELASLGEVFVNDAFGTAHRAHSSNVGVTKYLPSAAGILLEKEINYLEEALKNPQRPFVAILGGAKVSDKIGVIENLLDKVDSLVIVGAMANTFLKSQGLSIGKSLVEDDKLDLARDIQAKAVDKQVNIIIPKDVVVTKEISKDSDFKTIKVEEVAEDEIIVDIGQESINVIKNELEKAKTVVWNGPCGVFEIDNFAKGTIEVAKALANSKAMTIVGGGDSVSAIEKSGVEDKITHISTGGGASLEMLEGKVLPGIDAIEEIK